jgi:hypothetical protein
MRSKRKKKNWIPRLKLSPDKRHLFLEDTPLCWKDDLLNLGGSWLASRYTWKFELDARNKVESFLALKRTAKNPTTQVNTDLELMPCLGVVVYKDRAYYCIQVKKDRNLLASLVSKFYFFANADECRWVDRFERTKRVYSNHMAYLTLHEIRQNNFLHEDA